MNRRSHHASRGGHANADTSSRWPAVHPYKRGLQPPPNDPKRLYKECNRIAWALRCKAKPRAQLALVLDRYDTQIVALRRQHDEYLAALEALDADLHRRALGHLRELDNPRMAIEWERRSGGIDDVT